MLRRAQALSTLPVEDRGWQETAELLHIHEQTLICRMRRVEQITGRSLSQTDDVAALWLALEAETLINR